MTDLMTLQCPNCAARLTVAPNTLSLRCEHCGMEHLIRQTDAGITLEFFARCPQCGRNDKVEKVTAILRSQTHATEGVTYQNQTSLVKVGDTYRTVNEPVAMPIRMSQTSELAQRLAPPARPVADLRVRSGESHLGLAAALALIALGGGLFMCALTPFVTVMETFSAGDPTSLILLGLVAALTLLPVAAGLLLFALAVPRESKRNQQKRAAAEKKQQELLAQHQEQLRRWQVAVDRWNRLYYCGRDDCVFEPGANSFAPVGALMGYVYR